MNSKKPLFDDLNLKLNFTDITYLLFKDESDIINLKTKIDQLDTKIINHTEKERLKSLINIFSKKHLPIGKAWQIYSSKLFTFVMLANKIY